MNGDIVKQLAAGALDRSPATMAIAISGVLSPEPNEDGNPVGIVYFCLIRKDQQPTVVKEEFANQLREKLPEEALHRAFDLIEASVSAHARKHA